MHVCEVELLLLRITEVCIVKIGELYHCGPPYASGDDALTNFADDVVDINGA